VIDKIPYRKSFPTSLQLLMEHAGLSTPRQKRVTFMYTNHVDITYTLKMGHEAFEGYHQELLFAAEQDCRRYKKEYPDCMFCGDVEVLIRVRGDQKRNWGIHTSREPEDFVWGPGYEVPQYHLQKVFDEILDIPNRYPKATKRSPYLVKKLVISVYERA